MLEEETTFGTRIEVAGCVPQGFLYVMSPDRS